MVTGDTKPDHGARYDKNADGLTNAHLLK